MMTDKDLTDDVLDEIIAGAKTSMEQYLALSLKAERAAKQKSDSNSPVTPDGWISCSDRMPENIPGSCKEYLVFDGLNNKVHHDYWVVPDGDSAPVASFWNHYGAHVTHWMPLPEPPQEAK